MTTDEQYNCKSSAHKYTEQYLMDVFILHVYKLNNGSPKMEPCGTPHKVWPMVDVALLISIY